MTLKEMKKKVLGLIEELNQNSELLTEDPDIATKINDVINQVVFELSRHKKIPRYVEMEVKENDLITFDTLEAEIGNEIYKVNSICGVVYSIKSSGTVFNIFKMSKKLTFFKVSFYLMVLSFL